MFTGTAQIHQIARRATLVRSPNPQKTRFESRLVVKHHLDRDIYAGVQMLLSDHLVSGITTRLLQRLHNYRSEQAMK